MFFEIVIYTIGLAGVVLVTGSGSYTFYKKYKKKSDYYTDRILYENDFFSNEEETIIGPIEYDESESEGEK